jgi:hypothetical protein
MVVIKELRRTVGLLGLLYQRSRAVHSLWSSGCDGPHSWLPHDAGQIDIADEWARPPLTVSGVS